MSHTDNNDNKIIPKPHPPQGGLFHTITESDRIEWEKYELDKAEYLAYLTSRNRKNLKGNEKTSNDGETNRLIYKNKGDYFYDGKRIEMAINTVYYKIFDALCDHSDQENFLSYDDIEKHLIDAGEIESEDTTKRNKRIVNAISGQQGLFRFAKINGKKLKNQTPDGNKLVEIIKGKGLKLNNPSI